MQQQKEACELRSLGTPAKTAQDLLPPPPTVATITATEGAASKSKDHTKTYTEAKTWSRPEDQEDKARERRE